MLGASNWLGENLSGYISKLASTSRICQQVKNVLIPPLQELLWAFPCLSTFNVLKEINNKIIKCTVIKPLMNFRPLLSTWQGKYQLSELSAWSESWLGRHTWTAAYAIERGETLPSIFSVVATSFRTPCFPLDLFCAFGTGAMFSSSMSMCLDEAGDVNIYL